MPIDNTILVEHKEQDFGGQLRLANLPSVKGK